MQNTKLLILRTALHLLAMKFNLHNYMLLNPIND